MSDARVGQARPRLVQVILRLPPAMRDALNAQAAAEQTTAAQWLRTAIRAQLKYAQLLRGEQ